MDSVLHTTIDKKKALFRELYQWEAPERFWKPKEKSWYVSYFTFFISLIALSALLGQYFLIIAIVAFMFLWFVQGSTPPEIAVFVINSMGIRAYGKLYKWKDIKYFWFSSNSDVQFLNLDTVNSEITSADRIFRISILIPTHKEMEDVFYTMVKYVDYGEKDEVGYNVLNKLVHGNYIDVNLFLPEETDDEKLEATDPELESAPKDLSEEERKDAIRIAKRKINK